MSKFTPLNDELHAYMVEHGARQDEVLRRVQEETEAMGDIAVMQIAARPGRVHDAADADRSARGRRSRSAPSPATRRSASPAGSAPAGGSCCCELSEEYAEIAARNFEAAGVADRIEIRIGPALDTLRALPESEAFDITFIDADKASYPDYYEEALPRTRPGGLILLDNVLRNGTVVDPGLAGAAEDENLRGTLRSTS